MLPILTLEDFKGYFDITQNDFISGDFELYVAKFEERYIRRLLSDEAYQQIRDQDPLSQKYLDLINGADWVDSEGDKHINKGLKEVLKHFIYYSYVTDNFSNRLGGNFQQNGENATRATNTINTSIVYGRYNEGVDIFRRDVCPFVLEFDIVETIAVNFIDNADNTYTLICENIDYLQDGDEVSVDNTVYLASNVDTDAKTFDIDAGSIGLTFNGSKVIFEPFEDYLLPNMKLLWL